MKTALKPAVQLILHIQTVQGGRVLRSERVLIIPAVRACDNLKRQR